MEATIRHNLEEGIVKKNAVTRKPTAHDDVVVLDGAVEEITKFGQKMLKIAIHCQHVAAAGLGKPFCDRVSDTIGRAAMQSFYALIPRGHLRHHQRRAVSASIVDEYNLLHAVLVQP